MAGRREREDYLQEVVPLALEVLEGGSGGVVSGPVRVRVASVWEEVVIFGCPGVVGLVHGLQVAGRCGVEQIHLVLRGLVVVDVPDGLQTNGKLLFQRKGSSGMLLQHPAVRWVAYPELRRRYRFCATNILVR